VAVLLMLSGCGRRPNGLDLPPSLAASGDAQPTGPTGPAAPATATATAQKPALGPDGKPLPPPVEKRNIFLDWLID